MSIYLLAEGYDDSGLQAQIVKNIDYETFFSEAPHINPNAAKISGVICGHRVEEIFTPEELGEAHRAILSLV